MWLTIGMIVFLGACIAVPFVLVPRLRKASRPLPDIGPAEVHDQGVVAGRGYEHDPPAGYTGPPQLGWFSVWRAASPADRANVEYE